MTDSKPTDHWAEELVGAISDPVIVYPSGWQDTLPDWIKPQITLERLIMNVKVSQGGGMPVGDTEVLAYMFPWTMECPIGEQWIRIYTYVFTQAMKFRRVELPVDMGRDHLSDYDMDRLNHLKRWIYEQRVKYRKEKARKRRHENEQPEKKELDIKPVQPSFF